MRIFKDMNLVEQLGSGVKRILQAYDENIFCFSQNFLTVSFPYDETAKSRIMKSYIGMSQKEGISLNVQEQTIVEYLKKYQFIKRSAVEDILNIKKTSSNKLLAEMMSKGIICTEGKSSVVKYVLEKK